MTPSRTDAEGVLPNCYRCKCQPCECADGITLYHADCRKVLPLLEPGSVDLVLTDPPYGLEFMGKEWDKLGAHADARTRRASEIDDPSKGKYIRFGVNSYGSDPSAMQAWFHEMFTAILPACKPGAMLAAFGGTRTYHRLTCGIEDAGWEMRDCMMWLYGSGFPKSHDVSKAIDRQRDDYDARCKVAKWLRPHIAARGFSEVTAHFGFADDTMTRARWTTRSQPQTPTLAQWAELKAFLAFGNDMDAEVWRLNGRKGKPGDNWDKREVVGEKDSGLDSGSGTTVDFSGSTGRNANGLLDITAPATEAARLWDGYGTALKPAWEPIVLAMKPLEGTFAQNALEHGVAGLNIDGGRIGTESRTVPVGPRRDGNSVLGAGLHGKGDYRRPTTQGRWPANLLLQHCTFLVCRLEGIMPVDIEQQIRRYFDDYDKVQGLREGRGSAGLAKEAGAKVLFPGMCEQGEEGAEENRVSGNDLQELRQDLRVHPVVGEGGQAQVLQPELPARSPKQGQGEIASDVREEPHVSVSGENVQVKHCSRAGGQESSVLEGREVEDCGGLRRGDGSSIDAPAVGDSQANVVGQGPCDGAQIGDGDAPGQATETARICAPHQRREKRQSAGESGVVSQRGTLTKAQGSGAGVEQSSCRNPPLEVLACDVPQEWLCYFVETGEDLGCKQVGVKKVKGKEAPSPSANRPSDYGMGGDYEPVGYADADGLETVEAWECHAECPVGILDRQSGVSTSPSGQITQGGDHFSIGSNCKTRGTKFQGHGDSGGASRFFYTSKASGRDRGNLPAEELPLFGIEEAEFRNTHPTVKPLEIMRYLLTLLYPPSSVAVCLDPFAGSGTTGVAAKSMGRRAILIECEEKYCEIASQRLEQQVPFV